MHLFPSLIHIRVLNNFQLLSRRLSINVAVVGSGPAGFYTTQNLLKNPQVKVDIYEKLPVPFGLVRYGVAPDHAEVKNVINSFTTIANSDRVNFYGNVGIGESVDLKQLINAYHAIVLSYGSAQDKLLNIEGEQTSNTISARSFVGWYNGLPADKDLKLNLDCDTACIIGQGNVALDCARIILRPAHLEKTDITSYAQQLLAKSKIRRIYVIGRRGPLQVSFTTKELRELIRLNERGIRLEPESLPLHELAEQKLALLTRQRRRLTELLINAPRRQATTDGVEFIFKFLSKPHKIVANAAGSVAELELQKMEFDNEEDFLDENAKPTPVNEFESIKCGLIIRSIGYKAVMIDKSLPVDNKIGAILNTRGRVEGHKGIYCSGWLATGASGVIAGTLQSSKVTAQSVLDDIAKDKLLEAGENQKLGHPLIKKVLADKGVEVVHFNDWLHIDELERRLGEAMGKSREKFVDIKKMLDVVRDKKRLEGKS